MPETTGSVSVDQSQLGGAVPQEQLYPTPYAPLYGAAPAGAVATGTTYMAQPASLPAPGAPIAVVFFADASSSLSDRAMGVLRNVILVQRQVGGQLRIIGHASERTAAVSYSEHMTINQRLSQARANAVARAVIRFGAAPGSISVAAVGSQQPVYLEVMPTGEAGNRRVEVYLDGAAVTTAAAAPAYAQPVAPSQPVTAANGSVTVDLSALDQPAVAGGYYPGGQAPLYGQSGSVQLADSGYAPPAVLSSGGLLYPPTQNPISMLTVPPPPGAEPYVAEQLQAPATATGAATPPSSATTTASTPTASADSSGTASNAAATTSEQTSTGGSTDSTQTGSAPAVPAAGTNTSASAGTAAATGTGTQQATTGTAADIGAAATAASSGTGASTQQATTGTATGTGAAATSSTTSGTGASTQQAATGTAAGTGSTTAAASGSETTTASAGGAQPAAAATLVDGQLRIAFQKDSAEIPDAAKSELDNLAQKMTADGTMRVELTAYASGTPDTATQARRLSLLRALAVRSYLIRQGVSSMRMDVRALGNKVQGEPADRVDLVPNSS
jgi:outer membrane protein OmpA-like peptidoglycan-associated protein